ncbi:hypothetical protein [Photorhabdus temperata]|uniref:Uncharacterized protein n=1 Tax=Photorhabdus temperata J3 TaxID=1389415 RepID=U7R591_PHOTE|nr:hypothetical protein [Photorhabdus temperata]ERT14507.1 hypothetical protein O185_03840 [Photorhabdus temperata J3]
MSADGINYPLKLDNEEYPQGLFNFMTKEGKNTGKVVIDVAPQDANFYYVYTTIFRQNLIAHDGKVLSCADQYQYVNFSCEIRDQNYGEIVPISKKVGTITISLNKP